jgi:hypothetical protein
MKIPTSFNEKPSKIYPFLVSKYTYHLATLHQSTKLHIWSQSYDLFNTYRSIGAVFEGYICALVGTKM